MKNTTKHIIIAAGLIIALLSIVSVDYSAPFEHQENTSVEFRSLNKIKNLKEGIFSKVTFMAKF